MKRDLISSFKYAINGMVLFFRERNARIHLIAAVMVVFMAYWLNVTANEWALLLICIALVMGSEALNSALEKLVDMVSPEISDQAGQVKDIAAGAVLLVAIAAAIVGLIILGPKLLAQF